MSILSPAEVLSAIDAAADMSFSADDAADRVAPLLEDISWLKSRAHDEITLMADDPDYLPGLVAAKNGAQCNLFLAEGRRTLLLVTQFTPPLRKAPSPRHVTFSGQISLLRLLGRRPVAAVLARRAASGCSASPIRLEPGEVVRLDERQETLWFPPQTDGNRATSRPILMLRARILIEGHTAATICDLESGGTIGHISEDDSAARRTILLGLLRAMQRTDAAPLFEAATQIGTAAVRWDAMREWLALDTAGALARLEAMEASDPDEAVRQSARATLTTLRLRQQAA